jgi:hypothetical protein
MCELTFQRYHLHLQGRKSVEQEATVLHVATSQTIAVLITTAVRISNPTRRKLFHEVQDISVKQVASFTPASRWLLA